MRQWYRMHDAKPAGVFELKTVAEARHWQEQGFGVFQAVNEFRGARRIENLERITAWAVDMDVGTKAEMKRRIESGPLIPTQVVETKRGFQVYWFAKGGQLKHWNALMLDRLVPYYGADKNARDPARILRVPNFLHLKDPANPFRVRVRHQRLVAYTERQIAEAYPLAPEAAQRRAVEVLRQHAEVKRTVVFKDSDGFWDRAFALDCADALRRLSGHPIVRGEVFTFNRTTRGNLNIACDGKQCSAFVDTNGRIGSSSGGGPGVVQWIRWYGASYGEIARVLKDVFPELVMQ